MTRKIKAHLKGYFKGIATVTINNDGTIDEVLDIEDIEDVEDCEVIDEIYQID
jgi:hypothetical protein